MSTKTKTLAKSLHTVTVLAKLAKLAEHFARVDDQPVEDAMDRLLTVLGYGDADDPYSLVDTSLTQATKALGSERIVLARVRGTTAAEGAANRQEV